MGDKQIVIYTAKDGSAELRVQLGQDTIWLTQKQMSELFQCSIDNISLHLINIFKDRELEEKSVTEEYSITASDGKQYRTNHYNLDAIIALGYRINSIRATQFRQWATRVLKDYAVKGYAVNKNRSDHINYLELEQAVDLISNTARSKQLQSGEVTGLLEVITDYMQTWILLQAYDDGSLKQAKSKKPTYEIELAQAVNVLSELKQQLISKKEATALFASERGHGLSAIIGSINQSFGGNNVYPTIADRAAHLLYFMVKDHPFTDGNKRSGAMLFIWYLAKNNMLSRKLNEQTLAAITLLVAQSDPKQKDIMVKLITNLII